MWLYIWGDSVVCVVLETIFCLFFCLLSNFSHQNVNSMGAGIFVFCTVSLVFRIAPTILNTVGTESHLLNE